MPTVLPSGVGKVSVVNGDQSANCKQLQDGGGFGINRRVDPKKDYAYAPMFRVAIGLAARYNRYANTQLFSDKDDDSYNPWDSVYGKFVTAERSDDECVVIDFRTMPNYMLHRDRYTLAGVYDA